MEENPTRSKLWAMKLANSEHSTIQQKKSSKSKSHNNKTKTSFLDEDHFFSQSSPSPSVPFVDHKLKQSANPDILRWLQDKNKIFWQQKREEKAQKKLEKETEKFDKIIKDERQVQSNLAVQDWLKRKQKDIFKLTESENESSSKEKDHQNSSQQVLQEATRRRKMEIDKGLSTSNFQRTKSSLGYNVQTKLINSATLKKLSNCQEVDNKTKEEYTPNKPKVRNKRLRKSRNQLSNNGTISKNLQNKKGDFDEIRYSRTDERHVSSEGKLSEIRTKMPRPKTAHGVRTRLEREPGRSLDPLLTHESDDESIRTGTISNEYGLSDINGNISPIKKVSKESRRSNSGSWKEEEVINKVTSSTGDGLQQGTADISGREKKNQKKQWKSRNYHGSRSYREEEEGMEEAKNKELEEENKEEEDVKEEVEVVDVKEEFEEVEEVKNEVEEEVDVKEEIEEEEVIEEVEEVEVNTKEEERLEKDDFEEWLFSCVTEKTNEEKDINDGNKSASSLQGSSVDSSNFVSVTNDSFDSSLARSDDNGSLALGTDKLSKKRVLMLEENDDSTFRIVN